MAQLFPKSANTLVRAIPLTLVAVIAASVWGMHTLIFSPHATDVGKPIDQPVPFSHEHHVGGLGIDCRYCHTGVEKSASAGIPPTETCMTCHSQVWRDAPALAPVKESWSTGRPLRWTRVNDLPDYVYFDHSIHVQKGVACVTCHGRVDQMPLTAKAHTLYMRWCLDCHRAPEEHLQPGAAVFAMNDTKVGSSTVAHWILRGESHGEQAPAFERGLQAVHEGHIRQTRLEDCSICHR